MMGRCWSCGNAIHHPEMVVELSGSMFKEKQMVYACSMNCVSEVFNALFEYEEIIKNEKSLRRYIEDYYPDDWLNHQ
jgi:hypothetical protein